MDMQFFLYIALFVVLYLILYPFFKKKGSGDAAKKIHGELEQLYAGPHEFRQVRPDEFPHISTAHYDECEGWLTAHGFKKLGDLEDLTLTKVYPYARTYLRVFISNDGSVAAACFDINPQGWWKLAKWFRLMPQNLRTLEFESEFVNGAFLRTSNALGKQLLDEPPAISQNPFADTTPWQELLEFHRDTIGNWRQADEGFTPRLFTTLDDVLGMQHREQEITNAWRKEIGYVKPEEMKRMAGKSGQKSAEQVMREIQRINDDKRLGPPPLSR